MYDNENVINEDEPVINPVEPETNPDEDLPMEDKKKAINLQDLVFVRQYIDGRADEIQEQVSTEINDQVSTKIEQEVGVEVERVMSDNYYNKSQTDETFYKRTDTVDNAVHAAEADEATHATSSDLATYAEDAGKVNGIEFMKNSDGVIKLGNDEAVQVGDIISPQKKLLYSNTNGATKVTGLTLSDGKTYEVHARVLVGYNLNSNTPRYSIRKYIVDSSDLAKYSDTYISSNTDVSPNEYHLSFTNTNIGVNVNDGVIYIGNNNGYVITAYNQNNFVGQREIAISKTFNALTDEGINRPVIYKIYEIIE